MGKFRFNLQSVLQYREILEEQKKAEYGKELQNQKKIEDSLGLLNTQLVDLIDSSRDIIEKKVDIHSIKLNNNYLGHLKNEIKSHEISLQKQKKVVEHKRIDMLQAVTEKSSVQLLKDKHLQEYKIGVKKKEQKNIDELVSFKYTTA